MELEAARTEVSALWELVDEAGMPVGEMERASYATFGSDWDALTSARTAAKAARDDKIVRFGADLDASAFLFCALQPQLLIHLGLLFMYKEML